MKATNSLTSHCGERYSSSAFKMGTFVREVRKTSTRKSIAWRKAKKLYNRKKRRLRNNPQHYEKFGDINGE